MKAQNENDDENRHKGLNTSVKVIKDAIPPNNIETESHMTASGFRCEFCGGY
jgi:hypothetical protein